MRLLKTRAAEADRWILDFLKPLHFLKRDEAACVVTPKVSAVGISISRSVCV